MKTYTLLILVLIIFSLLFVGCSQEENISTTTDKVLPNYIANNLRYCDSHLILNKEYHTIINWEYSTDNENNWTKINTTSETYRPENLSQATKFRVALKRRIAYQWNYYYSNTITIKPNK